MVFTVFELIPYFLQGKCFRLVAVYAYKNYLTFSQTFKYRYLLNDIHFVNQYLKIKKNDNIYFLQHRRLFILEMWKLKFTAVSDIFIFFKL